MRFLTLFVEKIAKHPQIKDVPADVRKANKAKLSEILPITETLKKKLLQRYQKEYEEYLVDQEIERKRALEEAKRKVRLNLSFELLIDCLVLYFRSLKTPRTKQQLEPSNQILRRLRRQHLISQTWIELFIQMISRRPIRRNRRDFCQELSPRLTEPQSLHSRSWRVDSGALGFQTIQ